MSGSWRGWVKSCTQPADELHRAHGEPLEGSREKGQFRFLHGQTLLLFVQAFGAPRKFRLVAHCVDAFEFRLAPDHQVVRHAQELCLHGFGIGRTGPCLGLAQLVLEFVEGLFDLPAQPVEVRDDSGRQRAFAGQEAELLTALRAAVAHPAHADSLAGGHQFVAKHARVARIGAIPSVFSDDFQFHVLLFATQKIEPARVLPVVPLSEIDAGAVPDIEHLAPLGGTLAQRWDAQPLERTHVVLLAPCGLIGPRQMRQRVRAQIERKEMADGVLASVPRITPVVSRVGVKVAVARVKVEAGQLGHAPPPIAWQRRQARGETVGKLRDQRQAACAFEGLEEMGKLGHLHPAKGKMLEERASARVIIERAAHAELQPVLVGQLRADALIFGASEQIEQGSEEAQGERGSGISGEKWKSAGHENFREFSTSQRKHNRTETRINANFTKI